MRKLASLFLASIWMLSGNAAEPTGYYTSCEGYHGQALLSALSSKIASHTNVGYDGLWNVYKDSDMRPDGTLWDIYILPKHGQPALPNAATTSLSATA